MGTGSGGPPGGVLPDFSASAVGRGSSVVGAAESSSSPGPCSQTSTRNRVTSPVTWWTHRCLLSVVTVVLMALTPLKHCLTYNCHWPDTSQKQKGS